MPAPQGQSFYVVPANSTQANTVEYRQYSAMVEQALRVQGYIPAASPETATMLVNFNYGIDNGRIEYVRDPMLFGPYGSYGPYGPYSYPLYAKVTSNPSLRDSGAYYALSNPLYSPYGQTGFVRQKIYESYVDLDIRRRTDNTGVFAGHAISRSSNGNPRKTVPKLVSAMFTGFPGTPGETRSMTVPAQ